MKNVLRLILKLAVATALGAAAMAFANAAHAQEHRVLLSCGDTLVISGCPESRYWVAMKKWESEPFLTWNRVYPYLKPVGFDMGARRPEWYTAFGLAYRTGTFTSVSLEWRGVYGRPDVLSLSTKLSLR